MNTYKNVMRVLDKHANDKESYLINSIFPALHPATRDHLAQKLENIVNRVGNYYSGLFYFYNTLDAENSAMFDKWFEWELTKLV